MVEFAEIIHRCMSVTGITENSATASVQLQHESESFVDRFQFVVAEPPNEFAESLVRYR